MARTPSRAFLYPFLVTKSEVIVSEVTECITCGGPLHRPKTGRRPRYCSISCKQDARNTRDVDSRMFSYIKRHYLELGEPAARLKLNGNGIPKDDLLKIVERYLSEPVGQHVVSPEVIELLMMPGRGYTVLSHDTPVGHDTPVSHDTPLQPSTDIDEAESSGDWSSMLDAALKSMSWQFEHGYQPDLREFGRDSYGPVTAIDATA